MYMAMGIMIGSAVAPIMMTLLWRGCTPNGAMGGTTRHPFPFYFSL